MKACSKYSIQWHPLFVHWCLNVMLSSPKTYNIIHESGVIHFPSQRTLKDYTRWFKPDVGYQIETFLQLFEDYKVGELNPAQRYNLHFSTLTELFPSDMLYLPLIK